MRLRLQRIDSGLPVPSYAHIGDAGLDLYSSTDVTLAPGNRVLVPTGVAVAIPDGYAGFVQPRSGNALRLGLSFVNTPGLIDSHYRGEIKVIAINTDPSIPIEIYRGDRIAQLVIVPVITCEVEECDSLESTTRGESGFGSTGV